MNLKLHTKFILLLTIVALVPIVIVATFTFSRFQESLRADATKLGHQLATNASAEIEIFVVSQLGILDNIAGIYQPEFPIQSEIAQQLIENILFGSQNFLDITVVNTSGMEIARKNRLLIIRPMDLRDRSDTPEYAAVKDRGIYVGPVYLISGRPYFNLGRRILNAKSEFSGAVFAQVDARVMPTVVAEISKLVAQPGRVYIVNERGIVIAHPDQSYVLAERDLSGLPIVHGIITGENADIESGIYENELGQSVLGSMHRMVIKPFDTFSTALQTDWYIMTEQPTDVVYAGARHVLLYSILISLIAAGLAIAAALFFAGKIAGPIESLHKAALQFASGNFGHRAPIESGDEIGDLAGSFNAMAATIAHTLDTLKHEEAVVSAERNKLGIILAGITNAVIATDLGGRVILFNKSAEALTGQSADSLMGKQVSEAFALFESDRELSQEEYCPSAETADGPVYHKSDLRMRAKSGEEHRVNLVTGKIKEGASIELGHILTFQDITKEYQVERMKREVVSIAAHQLRTPLTGMKWAVDSLISGDKGELKSEQKTLAQQALEAVDRMIRLVNDLLNVNQVEEGRLSMELKRQSISPLIERVLTFFRHNAERKEIMVETHIGEEIPKILFDEEKIEIVLNNVLDNAVKYTPSKGRISVDVSLRDGSIVISVRDSGIGISVEDSNKIFTKFFRSPQAHLRHTDGSGLGLYVAKHIIEKHGGKIWFESPATAKTTEGTEEKKETTFFVSLPIPKE